MANEEFTWDPRFAMGEESSAIAQRVWPRFLSEEGDLPQPSLRFEIDAQEFQRRFPAWGLREKKGGRLVAYANAVLLACDKNSNHLPDDGWQFAIEAGGRAEAPNCVCLVVANVCPSVQGRGLSALLIEKAKAEAVMAGLSRVIAPVRPSHWHERQDLSFDEYVDLRRDDGTPADPWLRAHERAGAERLNICRRSAVVTASVQKWSEWTGRDYPRSGAYPLEGGLAPLWIDLEKSVGVYTEPNVWVRYDLAAISTARE